jgi:glycerate dehydrogenase
LATGHDVVDGAAARALNLPLCNAPGYSTPSVVEHTLALLLELCRSVGVHDLAVHAGDWTSCPDFSFAKTPQLELEGRTLGVVGYGNIGQRVAAVARALGMRILASTSRQRDLGPEAENVSVEELFEAADVVSLHCPLTPETKEIVRWERLLRMKSSALLLNTSRGGLVREADLARALAESVIAGAAVDVLDGEPPTPDNPLLSAPRCIITPHIAWRSLEARTRLIGITRENVSGILEGRPVNVVN